MDSAYKHLSSRDWHDICSAPMANQLQPQASQKAVLHSFLKQEEKKQPNQMSCLYAIIDSGSS